MLEGGSKIDELNELLSGELQIPSGRDPSIDELPDALAEWENVP